MWGEVKELLGFLGGKLLAPHIEGDGIVAVFGERNGFQDVE